MAAEAIVGQGQYTDAVDKRWRRGPWVTVPIIGPRRVLQLEDTLGALDARLEERDRRRLDEAAPPGGVSRPYDEADFGPNRHRR